MINFSTNSNACFKNGILSKIQFMTLFISSNIFTRRERSFLQIFNTSAFNVPCFRAYYSLFFEKIQKFSAIGKTVHLFQNCQKISTLLENCSICGSNAENVFRASRTSKMTSPCGNSCIILSPTHFKQPIKLNFLPIFGMHFFIKLIRI